MRMRLVELMKEDCDRYVCNFKRADKWKVEIETRKVNEVLKYINTKNITETNTLLRAALMYVVEKLRLKKVRSERMSTKKKKDPW